MSLQQEQISTRVVSLQLIAKGMQSTQSKPLTAVLLVFHQNSASSTVDTFLGGGERMCISHHAWHAMLLFAIPSAMFSSDLAPHDTTSFFSCFGSSSYLLILCHKQAPLAGEQEASY